MNRECMVVLEKMPICSCNKCSDAFHNTKDMIVQDNSRDDQFLRHVSSAYVKVEKSNWDCGEYKQYFRNKSKPHIRNRRRKQLSPDEVSKYNNIVKPYKCPECDYQFVAQTTLQKHSIIHEPFPHVCHCGIGFYKQDDLEEHEKLVHYPGSKYLIFNDEDVKDCILEPNLKLKDRRYKNNIILPPLKIDIKKKDDGNYQCPDCPKSLGSRESVILHYRSVHRGERPYACTKCDKRFTQICALKVHATVHVPNKMYKCQYCEKAFSTFRHKETHERIHTGYKPYKCNYCEKAFSDSSAFYQHERVHTKDKRHRCPYCPSAFTDNSALYQHKLRHENKRKFKCDKCERLFYSKSTLKLHIDRTHKKLRLFACDHCKKDFCTKGYLIQHMIACHSKKQIHTCRQCFKTFYFEKYLKLHISTMHENRNKYTCELCYRQLATVVSYRNHMRGHDGIMFECDYCSKKYHSKYGLLNHILRLHNPLIYCKKCHRIFRTRKGLEKHQYKKMRSCEICARKFICKFAMKNHYRYHMLQARQYECDYCNKIFNARDTFIRHIRKDHGIVVCRNKKPSSILSNQS